MKRVSFEVAKALKEAGCPQWSTEEANDAKLAYDCDGELWEIRYFDQNPQDYYTAPTYLDVWLWLWREKGIKYEIVKSGTHVLCKEEPYKFHYEKDPEEAIIAAVNYLVENNLIK